MKPRAPLQRVGVLLAIAGVLAAAVCLAVGSSNYWDNPVNYILWLDRPRHWHEKVGAAALWLLIAAALLWPLYPILVRVAGWIRSGSWRSPPS
jgi:hypothetical protein